MAAVQVQVSVEDEALAARLVEQLLERRLIACGQVVGPIRSRYWWKGAIETASEWLLLLKTEGDRAGMVVAEIGRLHPATTPEILLVPVTGGDPGYLAWVRAETRLGTRSSRQGSKAARPCRIAAAAPKRPTSADLAAAAGREVDDVVAPGLEVLFCGINPGLWSAAVGHHFARPGNRFWKVLQAAGFTDELLAPEEERRLLELGIGVTNLVRRSTATAKELGRDELRAGAAQVGATVERFHPRAVAFLGVGAYRTAFGQPRATIGEQPEPLAGARRWVLPNPSGAQARYQLPELVELFADLRRSLDLPARTARP